MAKIKKAVVIPAYKVSQQIKKVVSSIPQFIDYIIVVDDKCPQSSGEEAKKINDKRVIVIYHKKNLGVGGSIVTGYKKAMELGVDIMIKMDGDGQMDPRFIDNLIEPLIENKADYSKGNRFKDLKTLKSMPKVRLFGNSFLSFFVKLSSGYWNIMDPTNGYTAIHKRALEKLDLHKLSKGYFFESDMLINLNIINAVVKDIAIPTRYGNEESSLKVGYVLSRFPIKLFRGLLKRIFLKYFLYDFNMASVYIIVGLPMFVFGLFWGGWEWVDSIITNKPRATGTIVLIALLILISIQMLLQAISIDINSTPRRGKKYG